MPAALHEKARCGPVLRHAAVSSEGAARRPHASEVSGDRLAYVCLKLPRAALDAATQFYTTAFPFALEADEVHAYAAGEDVQEPLRVLRRRLGLPPSAEGRSLNSAGVEFVTLAADHDLSVDMRPYNPGKDDVYWKIGLALFDLDVAVARLRENRLRENFPDCRVGTPEQFLDIGYLAHVSDCAGFTVELLQTTFQDSAEGRKQLRRAGEDQGVVMGQITTRISNKAESLRFYQEELGMRLLAIEPVHKYGFELYFLAFTDEQPPNPRDLSAVENREWLYQRPYTTLELQLREGSGAKRGTDPLEGGLEGIVIQTQLGSQLLARLQGRLQTRSSRCFVDAPDGLRVFVETR